MNFLKHLYFGQVYGKILAQTINKLRIKLTKRKIILDER